MCECAFLLFFSLLFCSVSFCPFYVNSPYLLFRILLAVRILVAGCKVNLCAVYRIRFAYESMKLYLLVYRLYMRFSRNVLPARFSHMVTFIHFSFYTIFMGFVFFTSVFFFYFRLFFIFAHIVFYALKVNFIPKVYFRMDFAYHSVRLDYCSAYVLLSFMMASNFLEMEFFGLHQFSVSNRESHLLFIFLLHSYKLNYTILRLLDNNKNDSFTLT